MTVEPAMPGLRFFTSNRLEKLSAALAENIAVPLVDPFAPETFLVQSSGMGRWLSMEIARHSGICANTCFYYPNAFIDDVLGRMLETGGEASAFDPEVVTWRIMKLLPEVIADNAGQAVADYVGPDPNGLRAYQLAARLADLFDQYVLFRPEMITAWEAGQETDWQASLWRRLTSEIKGRHRAALLNAFQKQIGQRDLVVDCLPERVAVFGVTALPRFHVEMLARLSTRVQVDFYLLNPCREYWGDILSDREMGRTARRAAEKAVDREWLHLDPGNRLLSSMGTLGRDFFEMIAAFDGEQREFFEDPPGDTLLSILQADMLNLRGPSPAGGPAKRGLSPDDRSVTIHSCHSPMREVEVLKDQMLSWFEECPGLRPGDILVMTPDIETYAPYVQAVFETPEADRQRIPYSIADRSMAAENRTAEGFLRILDFHESRFTVSEVLAVLELEAVQRKFGFDASDHSLIVKWIMDTRVRWGFDGENREAFGLPGWTQNTWRGSIDRLLLGYAMAAGEERLFQGLLPYDDIEGGGALLLGRFVAFLERLKMASEMMDERMTLSEWSRHLSVLLDDLFAASDESDAGHQSVSSHILQLAAIQVKSGFDAPVGIDIVKSYLKGIFESKGFGYGFITGGVTFCAMLPMRSVPFRIIALLGMNSTAFPRDDHRITFDLIAASPKPGDRSRRYDDQYLFLESILSVRDRLYISHVGQGIQDNSRLPPSVLVSALAEYIELGFEMPGKVLPDAITVHHRLQPFSAGYFCKTPAANGQQFFSYSQADCEGARAQMSERTTARPFIDQMLPLSDDDWRSVDIDTLCRFLMHPAKFLLQQRLGIMLGADAEIPEDTEPFLLDGLDRYAIEQALVRSWLQGESPGDLKPILTAGGRLPHGSAGEHLIGGMDHHAEEFAEELRRRITGDPLPELFIREQVGEFELTGSLGNIYRDHAVRFRYAMIRQKDLLAAWVHHLALNVIQDADYPSTTVLAGLKGKSRKERLWHLWQFNPVDTPRDVLQTLLEAYRDGLQRPLDFFPEASRAYIDAAASGDVEKATARARSVWAGSQYAAGEGDDPYYYRCFSDVDVIGGNFGKRAEAIYGPLLAHVTDVG